jgi:hypothetical protein
MGAMVTWTLATILQNCEGLKYYAGIGRDKAKLYMVNIIVINVNV